MINLKMKNATRLAMLLLTVILVACGPAKPKPQDNHWTANGLRGQVKVVKEITYRAQANNGQWMKTAQNQTYNQKVYSAEGFLLTETNFYTDTNEFASGFKYVYDDQNQVTRVDVLDPAGTVVSYSDIEKREGKIGLLAYTDYYVLGDSTQNIGRTELKWQDYKIIGTSAFDEHNDLLSTTSYEYNDAGDIVIFRIKNFHTGQPDMTMQATYEAYDPQGNWTRQHKEYPGYNIFEIAERTYEYWEQ